MVRLTDRPDMTLDVYRGRKTTIQQQQQIYNFGLLSAIGLNSSSLTPSLITIKYSYLLKALLKYSELTTSEFFSADTPLGEVKVGELPSWLGRRNMSLLSTAQMMGRGNFVLVVQSSNYC